jgi:acetyl-CoA carboxylase carboxyl transferase subunit alpha
MHGDRRFGDDPAVVSGIARLDTLCVTVIGIEKGKTVKEKAERNFGSVHPEGYRKALRQMKLAEKFKRPVICFVDTSGAYCGIGAEERGQGQAIAENLMEMMTLKIPVISILIGEGGSGGALALAVADEVWMLENAIYSVISPEGCASILWKDSNKVKEASACLKMTAEDLYALGVIEKIIPENKDLFANIKKELMVVLAKYKACCTEELAQKRYMRFRRIGDFYD